MHTIDTNILLRAPIQYTGVPFNSYAVIGDKKVAVSSSGIFEVCCGTSDNGTDIDSHFAPAKTNFGVKEKKQLRYVHVALDSRADMLLEVSVDDKVAKRYTIPTPTEGQQYSRVTVSSEHKGYYFYLRIRNTNGNYFAIDDIIAEYYILTGGRK